MHLLKVVVSAAMLGMARVAAVDCAAGVTVYLTVTASPSTVTLFDGPSPEPTAASINLQVFTAIPDIHTSPEITATTTIFLTYTEAVRVAQATQSTGNLGNGEPYYFTEHEGSTAWLSGKAPATTDGTITGTTTVLVAPVPSGGNTHTSSTETVFLTVTSTRRITETIVEAHNTATTSARSFGGIGASGWNATSTTFQTVTIGPSGSGVIVSGIQFSGTGTASGVVQGLPTGYLQAASAASTNVTRVYVKRQVGSIVVATINGVVVSWTNVYNGGASATRVSTSSSSLAASVSPAGDSTTFGYAFLSSFQASTTLVASSQTSKASEKTIEQTAAPTTVTFQLASQTTAASATLEYYSSSSSTSSSTASAPTSTDCGEIGNFTLNFDDLPAFSPANNDTADYPPIFNPYDNLFFSGGYAYAPPPTDPFQPISPPHLAVFAANLSDPSVNNGTPQPGDEYLGEFGAGPRFAESAYWIDAYGAAMGCDNKGPENCVVTFTGFVYSNSSNAEVVKTSTNVTIPPCPGLKNCILHPVTIGAGFTNLSGLRIEAKVAGKPVIWFMDNVQLAWSNNTCAAGLERLQSL